MRVALLDNSTLTSCQRLLGDIRVANLHNIDGDITAFENLIQATLFYDQVCYLDDYKPEFGTGRRKRFNFAHPLILSEDLETKVRNAATAALSDFTLRIEGGEISTSMLKDFFKQINLHLVFAWHMSGSDFLLTTKILSGDPEFSVDTAGRLLAMIASQETLRERANNSDFIDQCKFIGSDGTDVTNTYEKGGRQFDSEQVRRFASNLNWLCFRTAYYNVVALGSGCDAILHPIRSSFSLSFAHHKLGLDGGTRRIVIDHLKTAAADALIDIKKLSDPTVAVMRLPFFSAWIAKHAKGPNEFLSIALQLKNNEKISQFRSRLAELDSIDSIGNETKRLKEILSLTNSMNQCLADIRAEFGVETPNGISMSPMVNVMNSAIGLQPAPIKIPDLGIKLPGGSQLRSNWNARGYRGVFRSIIADLASTARLGQLHQKLSSGVVRVRDARYAEPKIEEPRYRYARPYWKIPM